jgi:hypothetical protein
VSCLYPRPGRGWVSITFLTNEPRLSALRKRFEGYTGPVVNVGGVR